MKIRTTIWAALLALLMGAVVGCDREHETQTAVEDTLTPAAPADRPVATTPALERLEEKARDAAEATRDYVYAQRAEFREYVSHQLGDLNRELDELVARTENAGQQVKQEAREKLESLRMQIAELTRELNSVDEATESTWDEVKDGFRKGYDQVKDSIQEARQWLSEKIAP